MVTKSCSVDNATEWKLTMFDFICLVVLLVLGISAVVLIIVGIAEDVGGTSFDVSLDTVSEHSIPTFTLCSLGFVVENVAPLLLYCTWNRELYLSVLQPPDRAYGNFFNITCDEALPSVFRRPRRWQLLVFF